MAFFNARLNDIRLILSIQGYQLNNSFIVREVGYWCPKLSGVIQFNCKISQSRLDILSAQNIHISESECHGIKLKKVVKNGMASSDISSVIKCLYQATKIEGSAAEYIGILKEENVCPIIFKAGLGEYIIELDDLQLLHDNNSSLPSFGDIKFMVGTDPTRYRPCSLHENLRTSEVGVCARAKVEIIANHLKQLNEQSQVKPVLSQGQTNELFSIILQ